MIHYTKSPDLVNSITFNITPFRIEDMIAEFGADRKQTKRDTLINGITKYADKTVATHFLGKKILMHATNHPLYITEMPIDLLKTLKVPNFLSPTGEAFFIAATKELFKKIAAFLVLTYAHGDDAIFIYDVTDKEQPEEIVQSILQNGEPQTSSNQRDLQITMGFQKEII